MIETEQIDLDIFLKKYYEKLGERKFTYNDRIYMQTREKLHRMLKLKEFRTDSEKQEKDTDWLQSHRLLLFDNDLMINKFENQADFIAEIQALQQKCDAKQRNLYQEDLKETERLIREFDFRNYEKRFMVDIGTVLAAILGAEKAEKELLKNGMLHNYSKSGKALRLNDEK
eukprot:TRINITY_DN7682_c0_g2_i1.p1 TRINITY_DN7682_c0_g2~~TRINITY_DN7682_c0_g2_i1.p1  ORF type:complete len:171 (+),score=44.78 TRINITY_DN7682_c0_g2_i1:200-712(+)